VSVMVTGTSESADQVTARGVPVSWRSRLDLGTTPGKLRLLLVGLVVASIAWGLLASFTVNQYSSAASSVVASSEPLTLDAQHIYRYLSDADDTAATAFLSGEPEPFSLRNRYLADVRQAAAAIENATAMGGTSGATSKDLTTLSTQLPVYTGEIETARADNRVGYPVGAAYLREASNLMQQTLLPAAQDLYTAENDKLMSTSAQATGLPLVVVTIVFGLAIGYVLYRASRWLTLRTNRVLNFGLLLAGLAGVVSLLWLVVAFAGGRGDLLGAQARGSTPVETLARADIAALQAHADESLTLIDNSGDDQYQGYPGDQYKGNYLAQQKALGPGPGTLLTMAQSAAKGSPAAGAADAAVTHAQAWFQAHANLRAQDDKGNHANAVNSALGSGPGDAGGEFALLSGDLTTGIDTDQSAFDASARAGSGMYGGLEAAVIVGALVMAAGCAWGLSRRILEYRR
jgi:hypothetical protein